VYATLVRPRISRWGATNEETEPGEITAVVPEPIAANREAGDHCHRNGDGQRQRDQPPPIRRRHANLPA
jgi:hypothetical protein